MQQIEIALRAMGAPRQSRKDIWKPRPCVIRYREFRDRLREEVAKHEFLLPHELFITVYFTMPDSWSEKKKRSMEGQWHEVKPDSDNIFKAITDTLYEQDQVIHWFSVKKYWGREDKIIIEWMP